MHLISIIFDEKTLTKAPSNTPTSSPCRFQRSNIFNFNRAKFKKEIQNEINKQQKETNQTLLPTRKITSTSEFKLASFKNIRDFNSEIILIKKDKNKLSPLIDSMPTSAITSTTSSSSQISSAKKLTIETKLNDYLRLQQTRRKRFNPEKYADIVAKEFIPSFAHDFNKLDNQKNILNILRLANRINNEAEQQLVKTNRSNLSKSVQPILNIQQSQLLVQGNNVVVKSILLNRQLSNLQKSINNNSSTISTIKARLIPIRFESNKLALAKQKNVKENETDQINFNLEPNLSKKQGAYTSAVTSSCQLKSYSKLLSSVNDETMMSTTEEMLKDVPYQDIEFIYNQKQVNKLFWNISNRMRERTNSGKYKNRINIEGENVGQLVWPDMMMNQKSYKEFERDKLGYLNRIKPVKARWPLLSPQFYASNKQNVKNDQEEDEDNFESENESKSDENEIDYEDEL